MIDFKVFFSILFFQNIHFNDPYLGKRFHNGTMGLLKITSSIALLFLILGKAVQYLTKKGIIYGNGGELHLFIAAFSFFVGSIFLLFAAYITAMEEKDIRPDYNGKKDTQLDFI